MSTKHSHPCSPSHLVTRPLSIDHLVHVFEIVRHFLHKCVGSLTGVVIVLAKTPGLSSFYVFNGSISSYLHFITQLWYCFGTEGSGMTGPITEVVSL
jgi:hypothetical protein